jgi:hypothetical protein
LCLALCVCPLGQGTVYAVGADSERGAALTSVPATLPAAATAVDFVPAPNEHSATPGAPYATFSYTARADGGAFDAAPVAVSVEVTPRNDPPTIATPDRALTLLVGVNGVAKLDLAVAAAVIDSDTATGSITYSVTSLPRLGRAVQVDPIKPTLKAPGTGRCRLTLPNPRGKRLELSA